MFPFLSYSPHIFIPEIEDGLGSGGEELGGKPISATKQVSRLKPIIESLSILHEEKKRNLKTRREELGV